MTALPRLKEEDSSVPSRESCVCRKQTLYRVVYQVACLQYLTANVGCVLIHVSVTGEQGAPDQAKRFESSSLYAFAEQVSAFCPLLRLAVLKLRICKRRLKDAPFNGSGGYVTAQLSCWEMARRQLMVF